MALGKALTQCFPSIGGSPASFAESLSSGWLPPIRFRRAKLEDDRMMSPCGGCSSYSRGPWLPFLSPLHALDILLSTPFPFLTPPPLVASLNPSHDFRSSPYSGQRLQADAGTCAIIRDAFWHKQDRT